MAAPIYYTDSNGLTLNTAQWAKKLGISQSSFRIRTRKWPKEKWFTKGRQVKGSHMIQNPFTQVGMSSKDWAITLGLSRAGFETRFRNWGVEDPRTFEKAPASIKELREKRLAGNTNELLHLVQRQKGVNFCTRPDGTAALTAEWAEHYGVELVEFYKAMRHYGRNSKELYEYFEQRRISA